MFILIWLILGINVIIVKCEVCASFDYGSSTYKATFVEETMYVNLKTWNEIKEVCDDGYELVSINTTEENNEIFGILRDNCSDGVYAIGLSRESGSDRTMASSWNWESGEIVEYLSWANNGPNVVDAMCAFGYMTTYDNGMWSDYKCSDKFRIFTDYRYRYGYVCEKSIKISSTAETTVHPGSTTNQPTSSLGLRTALHDTITITEGLTTHANISSGLTHTNGPKTLTQSSETNEFKLTWIVVVPVASTLLLISILIIVYSCYNRLCCNKRTQKHPKYKMDEVDTRTSPIKSSFNESSDRKKEHKYETTIESENNQSSTLRVLDTESENYAIYNQEDDMGLLYTEIPDGTECEGEVDNPVYTTVTIKSDYGALDQPSVTNLKSDELGKPGSHVSKTKTDDNTSHNKDTCTGSSHHDASSNMCDNEEVKHLEDLYARPDMSKKVKSKMKHSDNKTPSNIRKNDTVSSPTDVIASNTTAEVNEGQDMINNNHNTGDVNGFRRNLDYEVVDLDGV